MTEDSRPAGDVGDIVQPRACALAVAIPLTVDELAADFDDPRKEFVRTFVAKPLRATSGLAAWNNGYADIASHVLDVIGEMRRVGVTVVQRATLADVARL